MPPEGSVTHWIALLKAGEEAAAQPLWEAYCRRLAGLARQYLQHAPRQAAGGTSRCELEDMPGSPARAQVVGGK